MGDNPFSSLIIMEWKYSIAGTSKLESTTKKEKKVILLVPINKEMSRISVQILYARKAIKLTEENKQSQTCKFLHMLGSIWDYIMYQPLQ